MLDTFKRKRIEVNMVSLETFSKDTYTHTHTSQEADAAGWRIFLVPISVPPSKGQGQDKLVEAQGTLIGLILLKVVCYVSHLTNLFCEKNMPS